MAVIRLIHWNAAEAAEKAGRLQAEGYIVDYDLFTPAVMRGMRDSPPAAVVIDLTRLPSQGRDVALQLRQFKSTRFAPIIFVGGLDEKVAPIRALLPDAVFTVWDQIQPALDQALASPPGKVVVPSSSFAAYAGASLVKKLGIRPNAAVGLIDAPAGFEAAIQEVPEGVRWFRQLDGKCDLILWFLRSSQDLVERLPQVKPHIGKGGLWMLWPKKLSGIETDLSQVVVRRIGLAAGLVDYKISAIDETWAGLRFTLRKAK